MKPLNDTNIEEHCNPRKMVSIIIPCYNESQSLPHLYPALSAVADSEKGYEWEFLFFNDGSRDDTLAIIQSLAESDRRVSYIDLSRNFGKEHAMLAGFDYTCGDCAVMIDADLQDNPTLIPEMIRYWEQGYQDVYARRYNRGKESWLRKKLSLAFYRILQYSTRFDVLENVGDFRLLDRKCIDALRLLRESERYTKGLFCWIGYRKKEIVFNRGDREHGSSHWSFFSLFSLAIEGIVSFTIAPLRISTLIGFLLALLSLAYLMWIIIKAVIWGDPVAGFPTLISAIIFLGSMQLFCLGIMGEYVGRIFNQTKNRPNYLVQEYYHSSSKAEHDR